MPPDIASGGWKSTGLFASAFEGLDHYLTGKTAPRGDWTDDEWGDYASVRALEILSEFGAADWLRLSEVWRERPHRWQVRLAEILADGAPDYAIPVLFQMILSPNDKLALYACGSLRGAVACSREIDKQTLASRFTPQLESRLNQLWGLDSSYYGESAREVLEHIKGR